MSKRTGTSNSKPAVTSTPAAGAAAKVTMPVVASTDQPESRLDAAERDPHAAGDRLHDAPHPGLRAALVALDQLERRRSSPSPVPSAWSIGVTGVDGRPER